MKHVVHPQLFAGLPYEHRQDIIIMNTMERGELHCVLDVILECTQVTPQEFDSKCKSNDLVTARMLFSTICRELLWHRIKVIGKFMGRHHSTVIHHTKTTQDLLKVDRSFNQLYHRCLDKAESKLTKYGFEHKGLPPSLRSQVRIERGKTSSSTQRLVFTQATSR